METQLAKQVQVWNLMGGDERLAVMNATKTAKRQTELAWLRACHKYIAANIGNYSHILSR